MKDSSLRSLPMETFVPALAHVNLTMIWMESVFMVWFFLLGQFNLDGNRLSKLVG